jgi:formate/nitrite transporter FocA (FNT family)
MSYQGDAIAGSYAFVAFVTVIYTMGREMFGKEKRLPPLLIGMLFAHALIICVALIVLAIG